jgi:accessory colonization factor AcfC
MVKGARTEAQGFLDYLRNSPEAAAVFTHYGFTLLKP